MNSYKFRIYENESSRYLETYEQGITGINFFCGEGLKGLSYFLSYPDIFTVEQSTGLLDKEGNLIYSGDIVEGSFYDTEYRHYDIVSAEVSWKDGMFNIASDLWHKPSLIIIGNKHNSTV